MLKSVDSSSVDNDKSTKSITLLHRTGTLKRGFKGDFGEDVEFFVNQINITLIGIG